MSRKMKNILMSALGFLVMGAFLVMCSEPMPGEDIGVWEFTWPKLVAIGVMAGCVWGINKLDRMTVR